MASFKTAFRYVMSHEVSDTVKYTNDPRDNGGETYYGISRHAHATWGGWPIIDHLKSEKDFPANLEHHPELHDMVVSYYKEEYWNKFWGDSISEQAIAEELMDTAVNVGVYSATVLLQKGLNRLNRMEDLYADIIVDGIFGTQTLAALGKYLDQRDPIPLLIDLNGAQCAYYQELVDKNKKNEIWYYGWLDRIELRRKRLRTHKSAK